MKAKRNKTKIVPRRSCSYSTVINTKDPVQRIRKDSNISKESITSVDIIILLKLQVFLSNREFLLHHNNDLYN